MRTICMVTLSIFFFFSCTERKSKNIVDTSSDAPIAKAKDSILFSMLGPTKTGIKFVNQLTETVDMNGLFYEYYYNGAGVSISDIDNDGLQDILFISNLRKNQLYLNRGNLKFQDITDSSGMGKITGYCTGVTNVDINNDGLMDYYISKSGKYDNPSKLKNELWVNQGSNTQGIPVFSEEASSYGLDIAMCSTQAAFFDYDLDGDLDMFLINHYTSPFDYAEVDQLIRKKGKVTGDRLFRNDAGKYSDVTQKAGLTNTTRLSYGLGLSIGDLNNDGWPDIYVANDYEGKDFLYLNNKNGTFSDVGNKATGHVPLYSMGTDMGDVNNDGWMDILSLDMMSEDNYGIKTSMSAMNTEKFSDVLDRGLHHQFMYNALQINNGVPLEYGIPVFSDVAQLAGVSSTDWSWGPLLFDMNNDGQQDLFVGNGIKRDFRNNDFMIKQRSRTDKIRNEDRDTFLKTVLNEMPTRKKENYFFKNNGDLSFSKMNNIWLIDIPTSSNGAAYGDLDNDGDLDLVVNNADDASLVYRNNSTEQGRGNYLKVKLQGSKSNTQGIGARVELRYGQNVQMMEHYLTRGFQSAVGPGLLFGLEEKETVDTITVKWPDGKQQQLANIPANQEIVLKYEDAKKVGASKVDDGRLLFSPMDIDALGLHWKHSENKFDDFKREILMPHKMSQFGPALAIGDFDSDGLEDLYLGGAKDQSSVLYKQRTDGSFEQVRPKVFEEHRTFEDVDAKFIDVDNDGDLDLYVVSGGNEISFPSDYYRDRLYENSDGAFHYRKDALPPFLSSGSCIRTIDYDTDGDQDLFIGGRQSPGRYPMPVKSFILQNNSRQGKIKYTDVTDAVLPELDGIGMVTDALIVDLNNDQRQDLVLVGEWMSPRLFQNTGKKFEETTATAKLDDYIGWWNTVKAADFDHDGDIDLIAGNLGLNYKYRATVQRPFEIYSDDFDQNGTLDIVLGYYQGENLYPLRGRQCSSNQMPFIKKKFETYDAFGKASLAEVYGKNNLDNALKYGAKTFATTYFENLGNGTFAAHSLDNMAQTTSVNDIMVNDFDKDGNLDLVLAGNLYGSEVETPRNDAGIGLYLQGDGKGSFAPVPMQKSGIFVPGEVRQIKKMKLADGQKALLFARNNNTVKLVKCN